MIMTLATLLLLLSPMNLMAKESINQKRHITVIGECDLKVIPDRARVRFTSENVHKDQKIAVQKTVEQIKKLKKLIQKLKLSEIQFKSSSYQVYPEKEWVRDRYQNKGFKALYSLDVTSSDLSRFGLALVKASEIGIKNIGQLQMFISTKLNHKTLLECLDQAALQAKQKASQLAGQLNFKIDDVLSLEEMSPNQSSPIIQEKIMNTVSMSSLKSRGESPLLEAGELRYHSQMKITFGIK